MDRTEGEIAAEGIVHDAPPIAQLPGRKVKVTTGARLGRKWYEVERLLLAGEPKLKIARMLKISAHSVRAVARGLDRPDYAALSGGQPTPVDMAASSKTGVPDTLREKAMQAVDAITPEKLGKASPQSCAIVADRLLNRAEAIEGRTNSLDALGQFFGQYGVTPSHSVSRVTLEQRVTVESATLTPQPDK